MRAIKRRLFLALGCVLFSAIAADAQQANKLEVSVAGVRNGNGVVRCGLYSSPNGFREPGKQFRGAIAQIKNGQANCVFSNLPAGSYALAVFHAEQNEPQLQTGMFGKPKQGFGFSRNPSSTFGPPSFADAAFDYKGGNQSLQIRLSY